MVNYLEFHRAIKTPYEIRMMREATAHGVRAHRAAERAFRAGASEFGIHLAYCQAARQDANDLPYGNIVALNEHGAVVTIEPGIYFADLLLQELRDGEHAGAVDWARVDALRPYGGIRIEDDVVCTEGDPINLTREAFAALG